MKTDSARSDQPRYSLGQMIRYILWLGATGFGGPVALVEHMQRDLVEGRHWLTEKDFKEGLTLAQIAPGPLAAQVAIYLGYCHYGVLGATLVGAAFVLPSFLMVVALGWLYVRFGGLVWMQAVFYGVGAAIIGIIASSALRLTKKTLGKDRLLWATWFILAAATFLTEGESILLMIGGGAAAWLAGVGTKRRKARRAVLGVGLLAVAAVIVIVKSLLAGNVTAEIATRHPASTMETLGQIAIFFGEAGAFVFGSGLAIVPFLYGGVVKSFGWLNERQFLDAVAVAMITPGPVVITVGFIGYLVAGVKGACVAAFATFFPCWIFTVVPAPYLRRHGASPDVRAIVEGVSAAATGAITGAVLVLGRRSIVDVPTVILAISAFVLLARKRKPPEPLLVAAAAIIGLLLKA